MKFMFFEVFQPAKNEIHVSFEAFSDAWGGANHLLASFGSFVAWRPLADTRFNLPFVEGLHLDQNPFNKPNFSCYQGMVPLLPVNSSTGGLRVVPKIHTHKEFYISQKEARPLGAHNGDWWPINEKDLPFEQAKK